MLVLCHDIFLLLWSGSTFPEVDPDPAKWYGSIRIRNTSYLDGLVNLTEAFVRKVVQWTFRDYCSV